MFRRTVTTLAVVGALALGVAPTLAQDPVQLRFAAINDPAIDRVQQMLVQTFQDSHPGSTVSVEYISGDVATQYATQAAAGSLADVLFTADLFVVPFSQQGITLDMQPLADAEDRKSTRLNSSHT